MFPTISNSPDVLRWLLALVGAVSISGLAWYIRSLSTSGMLAAIILGANLVGLAGWWAGLLLVTFFVTASLLSRSGRPDDIPAGARGSRRDAVQVIANGGVALACAAGFSITNHAAWLIALAGSIAAANADTWSTELGRRSPGLPRLITTGKPVPAGTSGAVSRFGLVAAAGGASLIGALAAIGHAVDLVPSSFSWLTILASISIAGFSGALVDSLLGATIQERRWCEICDERTEKRVHQCGQTTILTGGIPGMTNDVVNGLCVLSGAAIAGLGAFLLTG